MTCQRTPHGAPRCLWLAAPMMLAVIRVYLQDRRSVLGSAQMTSGGEVVEKIKYGNV